MCPSPGLAQVPQIEQAQVVEIGPQYSGGWLTRVLLGGGWRDLWTQPIELPVADLAVMNGGLEILRVSGGTTSATLHVQSNDGRRFVFRTVDKNPLTGQFDELASTIFGTALQDQISAFNPVAAPVVARLLGAVGVLHADPRLYVFPADVAVPGESDRFAGQVVLFEERPGELPDGRPGLGGFDRFAGTEALLQRTRASARHRVAATEFLEARLMDVFVGDRDRAVDNWRWAAMTGSNPTLWHPIPRDRDQAFVQMDGALKRVLSLWEPRLVRFDDKSPNVGGLSRNAWDLDRRYLGEIPRAQWDSVTSRLVAALSEEVLREAVSALPSEVYERSGEYLLKLLVRRRDALPSAADDFFELVNTEVDVWGTDEADSLHVSRSEDGATTVQLFGRGTSSTPYWSRAFGAGETRAIRVHLLEDDDVAVIAGHDPTVGLYVVGGPGRDALSAEAGTGPVEFLDGGGRTTVSGEGEVRRRRVDVPAPVAWGDSATGRDFGSRRTPIGVLRYSSDIGLVVGAGVEHVDYGLFQRPYASRWRIAGGITTGRNRGLLRFEQRSLLGSRGPWLSFQTSYSGVERLRFYGFGNETASIGPASRFIVLHDEAEVNVSLSDTLGRSITWSAGPVARFTDSDTTGVATVLAEDAPYGAGDFGQLGVQASLRRCPSGEAQGLLVRGRSSRCSNLGLGSMWTARALTGVYSPIGQPEIGSFAVAEGRLAAQLRVSDRVSVATRVGFRTTSRNTPFHHAAYIGGTATLRGYTFDRFVGNHAAFVSSEVRTLVGTLETSWFPLDVGLIGLVDTGRVWAAEERSTRWHTSWGGGVWLAPFKRGYTVHALVARGDEGTTLHVGPGFSF